MSGESRYSIKELRIAADEARKAFNDACMAPTISSSRFHEVQKQYKETTEAYHNALGYGGEPIARQPEYDLLHRFDEDNNVEPPRTIAERIAKRFYVGAPSPLVDAISHAIEDAMEIGQRRGKYLP